MFSRIYPAASNGRGFLFYTKKRGKIIRALITITPRDLRKGLCPFKKLSNSGVVDNDRRLFEAELLICG